MATSARRERERAQRHRLIIETARTLAEREGWQAVTTRRLAEAIEYSQPVIYSHFANMDAVADAVALGGIVELAAQLRTAREAGTDPRQSLDNIAAAYTAFAQTNPAVFDAIFTRPTTLLFADEQSPQALVDAFGEIQAAVAPMAAGRPIGTLTEVFWSLLHGLVTLNRDGRLHPSDVAQRLRLAVDLLG